MDPINSNVSAGAGMYAMKKAIDVQGQGLMKLLDSAQAPVAPPSSSTSGSSLTGVGQTLDIRG
ncbi:MAG: hypothetical protein WCW84_07570 [Sulfurimonas sp.]|jgi:hypothetical protein